MAKRPIDTLQVERQQAILANINSLVLTKNIATMDAILLYCSQSEIEIETVAQIIKQTPKIKATLQQEATALNFLIKTK